MDGIDPEVRRSIRTSWNKSQKGSRIRYNFTHFGGYVASKSARVGIRGQGIRVTLSAHKVDWPLSECEFGWEAVERCELPGPVQSGRDLRLCTLETWPRRYALCDVPSAYCVAVRLA